MSTSFTARALAWWLRLFFQKRGEQADVEPTAARRPTATPTFRAIPAGVDREAYRKVQRVVAKMQRKIEAGTLTEEQALRQLGLEP